MIGTVLRMRRSESRFKTDSPNEQGGSDYEMPDHKHHMHTRIDNSSQQVLSTPSDSGLDASFDLARSLDGMIVPGPPPSSRDSLLQPLNLNHELPCPITVFAALYLNGRILGLECSTSAAFKSPPASPDVPLSLQPTRTQLSTVHFGGIDRFPFPKMRDNLIHLTNEEEFSKDLFTMPSFEIRPGAMPWDARAWTMEKPFADKWSFLFY
ncbi:hypothetical protein LTR37_006583 [Vermiconidia calcicola]|uniref:Uncharacterized protein n=1 Tax=Vermiconidia calcicola TaxID=1690605 RepID=A0ACC3NFL9_9PEZI|nr:hypothetical protein LTR37_006583 [Vermiconidia calcicola]